MELIRFFPNIEKDIGIKDHSVTVKISKDKLSIKGSGIYYYKKKKMILNIQLIKKIININLKHLYYQVIQSKLIF